MSLSAIIYGTSDYISNLFYKKELAILEKPNMNSFITLLNKIIDNITDSEILSICLLYKNNLLYYVNATEGRFVALSSTGQSPIERSSTGQSPIERSSTGQSPNNMNLLNSDNLGEVFKELYEISKQLERAESGFFHLLWDSEKIINISEVLGESIARNIINDISEVNLTTFPSVVNYITNKVLPRDDWEKINSMKTIRGMRIHNNTY